MMYSPIIAWYLISSKSNICSNINCKYSLLDTILYPFKFRYFEQSYYPIYCIIPKRQNIVEQLSEQNCRIENPDQELSAEKVKTSKKRKPYKWAYGQIHCHCGNERKAKCYFRHFYGKYKFVHMQENRKSPVGKELNALNSYGWKKEAEDTRKRRKGIYLFVAAHAGTAFLRKPFKIPIYKI